MTKREDILRGRIFSFRIIKYQFNNIFLNFILKYNLLITQLKISIFSKASSMDSHCGPAWIGFAHTFAIESEH
ncbi:hypothetical protein C2G38_874416 [Gigaspora rosea]|uniref:Uncharacterized protein n=1 Tax=Gigaspora rosea TaxID=44941 RepID=A0A397VWB7_9GLOM|nr:hypothetical protein C2G38_874416 [Gigaspora rosea]